MTFLEFACRKLLGPPAHAGGQPGDSYWHCPIHADTRPSFHTLPLHPKFRHFWKCFGCGKGGDEFQLLRELREVGHPLAQGDFGDHKILVAHWRKQWEVALNAANGSSTGKEALFFSPVDSLRLSSEAKEGFDTWLDLLACDGALRDLLDIFASEETGEAFGLQVLTQANECCRRHKVTLEKLLSFWRGTWKLRAEEALQERREMSLDDAVHIQSCERPGCLRCEAIAERMDAARNGGV